MTRLGGEIQVDSTVEKGSIFRFTIRAGLPKSTGQQQAALGPIGRFKVLVVDDNPTNRFVISRTLQHWGLQVETADTGARALRLLQKAQFDVAVLDLRMPEMDGFSLAREIHNQHPQTGPKLLMLTASGNRNDAQIAKNIGIATYLTKPFRQGQLHSAVANLLRDQKPVDVRSAVSAPAEPSFDGHILVVDDNPINLRFARHALKRLGYKVSGASSGPDAIEMVTERPFDAIFMDCEMPDMNGFDTTRSLRQLEHAAKTPIIALTAHATEEIREQCKDAGMDDFVAKPPSVARLKDVLDQWVQTHRRLDPDQLIR